MQAAAPRRAPLHIMNLRVNNVEIPNSKRIEISLQYIFGIGQTTAQTILRDTVGKGWLAFCGRRGVRPNWRSAASVITAGRGEQEDV